jgi:hypothetical protein
MHRTYVNLMLEALLGLAPLSAHYQAGHTRWS